MRRLALAATLLVSTLGAGSAEAGPMQQLAFFAYQGPTIGYPVEQQTEAWMLWDPVAGEFYPNPDHSTWADNPTTTCLWDVDDQVRYWQQPGADRLGPGASSTITQCWFADHAEHQWHAAVIAPSPNLVVTIAMPNKIWTLEPVQTGTKQWTYQGCASGLLYGSPPTYLPEVVGSNGGYAVPAETVFTVSNPSNKTVASIITDFGSWQPFAVNHCVGAFTSEWLTTPYGSARYRWAT